MDESAIRTERTAAGGMLACLNTHPELRQYFIVENSPSWQTFGFATHLCDEAETAWSSNVSRAFRLARLSVLAAETVEASRYGHCLVADLRARAWGFLGNVQRIRREYLSAEESFRHALEWCEVGTHAFSCYQTLAALMGCLRLAQGRLLEGDALFEEALHACDKGGDELLRPIVLMEKARGVATTGRLLDAIDLCRAAVEHAESWNPRLVAGARHNLATYLLNAGYHQEAYGVIEDYGEDQHCPDRLFRWKSIWLQAKAAREMGAGELAMRKLEEALNGFLDDGSALPEAIELAVETALFALEMGDTERLLRVGQRLVNLSNAHLPWESSAVLLAFTRALQSSEGAAQVVECAVRRVLNEAIKRGPRD